MKKLILLLFVASLFFASPVMAADSQALKELIRLSCKYSHSLDWNGKRTESSTEDIAIIHVFEDDDSFHKSFHRAKVLMKSFSRDRVEGRVTEDKFWAEKKYKRLEAIYKKNLVIHKHTGYFEIETFVTDAAHGITSPKLLERSYGKCIHLKEKLF